MHCHNRTSWNWQQPNGEGISLATWERTVNPHIDKYAHVNKCQLLATFPKPNILNAFPSPQLVSDGWVCQRTTSAQSQMQTRNTSTSLEKYCKTAPYLVNGLCIHSLIQKKLHSRLWTMISCFVEGCIPILPKHKPLSFSSVQQMFCNICCVKHLNVDWAGFAATGTKTPCNALSQ